MNRSVDDGREPFKSGPHQSRPWPESEVGSAGSWGPHGHAYEKLLKQIAKLETDHADDDKKLARKLGDLVDDVIAAYEEEEIDGEEHDLLMDAIEDADPDERTFDRLEDDGDAFYDETCLTPRTSRRAVGRTSMS